MVRRANDKGGLRTCILRPGSIMGGRMMESWMDPKRRRVGKGNYLHTITTAKAAANAHLLAERYIAKEFLSSDSNTFNIVSCRVAYRDILAFFSQKTGGKKVPEVPIWVLQVLITINELTFWLTSCIPFNDAINSMTLDFFYPFVYSGKRAEQVLGWREHRPWQEVVEEAILEYKTLQLHTS